MRVSRTELNGAVGEAAHDPQRGTDPVRAYRFHRVRIGVQAMLLVVVLVAPLLLLFSGGERRMVGPAMILLMAAAIGAATIALAPWERLLDSRMGSWFLYTWSVFDVLLITLAILVTGGGTSELFFLYGLTTTLFAISYSPRGQAVLLAFSVACYMAVLGSTGWEITAGALVLRLAVLATLAFLGAFLSREMKRMLSTQVEVARKLRDLDDLRSDFLSTVSHELRTPLTAISGFATTLGKYWPRMNDEMRTDLVARITENSQHLDHLISELLDFTRIEKGLLKVWQVPADLRTIVVDALGTVESALGHDVIEVDIPDGITALADPAACERVLQNLVTNAAKFSPDGSRIRIEARKLHTEVVVSVRDEGIGIPAAEHQRIFERFYRVDRADSAGAGTGIGLAIVQQFVEAQGGRVWVESEPGQGSTFRFTLPAGSTAQRAKTNGRSSAGFGGTSSAGFGGMPRGAPLGMG